MELREINSQAQFEKFYAERNLLEVGDKISYLNKALQIRASRCDAKETPEEELAGLEDLVLSHLWEAFC